MAIMYASERLRKDRDLVMIAVKQYGQALGVLRLRTIAMARNSSTSEIEKGLCATPHALHFAPSRGL
eukprot:9536900-Alexandrium_andersonii.AAC.1